jgi:hypothetical protein
MTIATFWEGDPTAGFVILAVIAVLYFIPTFAARGKPQFNSVLAINFFLGWTLVGWVVALAWAVKEEPSPRFMVNQAPQVLAPLLCASCGKYSAGGSVYCASCGAPFRNVPVPQDVGLCAGCGFTLKADDKFCHRCGRVNPFCGVSP